MAIIDRKKLVQKYQWSKLTPSARALLDTFERFTDPSGKGSPTWGGLMYYSGITGKDTFKRARKQLIDNGLISLVGKSWNLVENNKKKIPRARITYQITKDILWNKSPINQSKPSNPGGYQSMSSESMGSRKEGDKSIGVSSNYLGASNQPTAGSNQIKEEKNQSVTHSLAGHPFGENQESSGSVSIKEEEFSIQEIADEIFAGFPPIIGTSFSWKESAETIARHLRINPEGDNEWYGFFKNVYERRQQGFLNEALFYSAGAVEDSNVKDVRKVFFSNFYEAIKEVE